MIKDKEIRDDWLFKEIQRESKISVWDFDEGKSIKRAHEEHCARQINADEHKAIHKVNQVPIDTKRVFSILAIAFVFVFGFIVVTIFSFATSNNPEFLGILPIIVFVVIMMLISLGKGNRR